MTAHEWTDAELLKLEHRIKREYQKAYNEAKADLEAVLSALQDDDGTMPLRKRMGLIAKKRKLDALCKQMADAIANAGKISGSLIDSSVASVYMRNYNAFASVLDFALITQQDVVGILSAQVHPFDRLALDALQDPDTIKRHMESELVTGLLRGESIPKIARRLQTAAEGSLSNAVRVARTEVTRVEASARNDIGKQGEKLGFDMGKRWIATKDKRTRPSHRKVDHAEVRMGELFELDGKDGVNDYLEFPGDVSHGAGPGNVCNCRCTVIPFIIGIKNTASEDVKTADTALLNEKLSVK